MKPTYQEWALIDTFPAWQAAWLLLDIEPPYNDHGEADFIAPQAVKATQRLLVAKYFSGRIMLQVAEGAYENISDNIIANPISRKKLKEMAIERGIRPAFLFPDNEIQPAEKPVQAEEKPISARERNTLLKILAAMAIDGYGNNLSKPFELAAEIAAGSENVGCPVGKETIGKYLKEAAEIVGKS